MRDGRAAGQQADSWMRAQRSGHAGMDGRVRSEQSGYRRRDAWAAAPPGCVVAAASTWATAPARWCVAHTRFISGKHRHAVDRGKVLRSKLSAATGRWSVHVDDRIGSADCDTCDRGGYGCLSGRKRGLQSGDRGWRTVRCSPRRTGEATGSSVCPKNPAWVYLAECEGWGCLHDRLRVRGAGGEERESVDAAAGLRFEFAIRAQFHDA